MRVVPQAAVVTQAAPATETHSSYVGCCGEPAGSELRALLRAALPGAAVLLLRRGKEQLLRVLELCALLGFNAFPPESNPAAQLLAASLQ